MSSEPVVVFYKAATCGHCVTVSKIWPDITKEIKKTHPRIRFVTVVSKDLTGQFDESLFPKDLKSYAAWFPMFLLISGNVWDEAMSNLGPNSTFRFKEGVKVMNCKKDYAPLNSRTDPQTSYNIRKPTEFARWVDDMVPQLPIVPIVHKPTLPNIIRPSKKEPIVEDNPLCSMRIISRLR